MVLFSALSAFVLVTPENAHHAILFIAIFLVSFGFIGIAPYLEAKNWLKSTAKILHIKEDFKNVMKSQYSETRYYYPVVLYTYTFEGKEYTNSLVSFEIQNIWSTGYNNWGDMLPDDNRIWHSWEPGTVLDVYIKPRNPAISVLLPVISNKRKSHHLALVAAGILVFLFWAFFRLTT